MTKPYALSLPAAILVNINIMIGAGIFVNTVLLARDAGIFGAVAYLMMGVVLLPLIVTFAWLMRHHKGGTFYDFGATLHPAAGFLSGWTYFVAKLASAALGIHVFSTLVSQLIPALGRVPLLALDSAIVIAFSMLNMLNVRIGRSIQYGFLSVKIIPIASAIIAGLYFFSGSVLNNQHLVFTRLVQSMPFVLYAFTGFEACCSLSRTIEDPERNGPRALLISYLIGVCIAVLYQGFFFAALPELGRLGTYSDAFPALLDKIFVTKGIVYQLCFFVLNLGIATSSLGAAYGIMYSNAWNLFALAQAGYTVAANKIASFNQYKAPFACVALEGVIVLIYLFTVKGELVPLQQICSLGMIITYTVSTIAFMGLVFKQGLKMKERSKGKVIVPLLALLSCLVLSAGYANNIRAYGAWPTVYFSLVLLAGMVMFLACWLRKDK